MQYFRQVLSPQRSYLQRALVRVASAMMAATLASLGSYMGWVGAEVMPLQ